MTVSIDVGTDKHLPGTISGRADRYSGFPAPLIRSNHLSSKYSKSIVLALGEPAAAKLSLRMAMRFALLLTALVAAGCATTAQPRSDVGEDALASGFSGLPDDARLVAERLASCTHFAGEFNGDRSDRDKGVAAAMTRLGCDTIDRETSAIRQKYARDGAVQEAMAAASQL